MREALLMRTDAVRERDEPDEPPDEEGAADGAEVEGGQAKHHAHDDRHYQLLYHLRSEPAAHTVRRQSGRLAQLKSSEALSKQQHHRKRR
jgi:hypothetical protein